MKYLKWCALLTKRLYKKPTFVAICLLIPLLVSLYSLSARSGGGLVTIALASEDPTDPAANTIIDFLLNEDALIRFIPCESAGEAETLVRYSKADGAWIFEDDLQNKICEYVKNPAARNAFVQVLEQEQNVVAMLAREKLTGTVFTFISEEIYLQFIREHYPALQATPDNELLAHYHDVEINGQLFAYAYQDRNSAAGNYLLAPVRGLLAVVASLCGLAAAMYFVEDCHRGTFSWVPARKLPATELICQMIAVGTVSIMALSALLISGMHAPLWQELLLLPPFILSVCAFSMVLRRIFRSLRLLSTVTPIMTVIMLCLCPVFIDFKTKRFLQILFPPTYYIHGGYNPSFILYLIPYIIVCAVLCVAFDKLHKKGRQ